MIRSNNVPRIPDQIESVIETIWWTDGRVRCPVCASPMEQAESYTWECDIGHCPITGVEFNEAIHSYGVSRKPSKEYAPK